MKEPILIPARDQTYESSNWEGIKAGTRKVSEEALVIPTMDNSATKLPALVELEKEVFLLRTKVMDLDACRHKISSFSILLAEKDVVITSLKKDLLDAKAEGVRLSSKCDMVEKLETEKSRLANHRKTSERKQKSLELKSAKLTKKISELQVLLKGEMEKDAEVSNGLEEKRMIVEKRFEDERELFRTEIRKLTTKLSELSAKAMKEEVEKASLLKKLDSILEERSKLVKEKRLLNTTVQNPCLNCTDFKDNLSQREDLPKKSTSNRLYETFVNNSGIHQVYNRVKMIWKVKGSTENVDQTKSFVPKPNVKKNNVLKAKSFGKPDLFHSIDQLCRSYQKKLCCSFCGANDFVRKEPVDSWYSSYNIPNYRPTTPNQKGPKFRWVPKSG